MKLRIALLACAATVLVGASSADAQDTTLRYRWVKADQVRYRTNEQLHLSLSGPLASGELITDQNSVVRMTVEDVAADGSATVRQTFESIGMEMGTPQARTTLAVFLPSSGRAVGFYHTPADKPADPRAEPMMAVMLAMVGESITLVLTPTGTVLEVEGMSRIFDKVANALSVDINTVRWSIRTAMGSSFEQGFAIVPDRTVSTGETWPGGFPMNHPMGGGPILAARTSTLTGVEQRNGTSLAHIAVTLAIPQAADPASPAALADVVTKMGDARGEGEILFDVMKGRLQKASFTVNMPMTTSMEALGLGAGSFNTLAQSTMTMEIVEP